MAVTTPSPVVPGVAARAATSSADLVGSVPADAAFQVLPTVAGESVAVLAAQAVSLALLAGLVTASAAFAFRLYTRESLPEGAALILGLGVVGLALNTRNVLVQFIGSGADDVSATVAAVEVATFVIAGLAASVGRLGGDRLATSDRLLVDAFGGSLGAVGRAVGRTITLELPESIEDIDGYEPVAEETKAALQGRTLDFPRGLSVAELETKLAERLREAHDVGYVDAEVTADRTVTHLGLGRRPAGLGATLPPGTVGTAVRCDPPFSASPGDTVQVWRVDDGDPTRLGTGELRATTGDVATVVLDEAVADEIDPATEYRLVTLSSEARPDREFAAILRRAHETMLTVEVTERSPLIGNPLAALAITVVAVGTPDGDRVTLPPGDRTVRPGDELVVLGPPAALRELATAAVGPALDGDGSEGSGEKAGEMPVDGQADDSTSDRSATAPE